MSESFRRLVWIAVPLLQMATLFACRPPSTPPPPPRDRLDSALQQLPPQLLEIADSRLNGDLASNSEADLQALLADSTNGLDRIRELFQEASFGPLGEARDDYRPDESTRLKRMSTICWILRLDSRVMWDADRARAKASLLAVLDAVHRLVGDQRTLSSLEAARILSRHSDEVLRMYALCSPDERFASAIRERVRPLDSERPLNFHVALLREVDILMEAIIENALADSRKQRDAGLLHDPDTGAAPSDAELESFVRALCAKKRVPLYDACKQVFDAWPDKDDTLAIADAMEAGKFGTLAQTLGSASRRCFDAMKESQSRIARLREGVGLDNKVPQTAGESLTPATTPASP